jgi:hypothetical protein
MRPPPRTSPTLETYQELQRTYDHFNGELFASAVPFCLITFQRAEAILATWGDVETHTQANENPKGTVAYRQFRKKGFKGRGGRGRGESPERTVRSRYVS